ncbi:hypothetical protein O181_029191 [Austropuccinia psidii MF-1]|uniref:Uncharacterized protein n=1 Tax=Austropuccinia psidii MF-1 TaxID=1389203 RepID=A0A9Q3H330_9BASI|nr:hypothetical protein [Austropuccinia psidii MF-1]
MFCGTLRPQSPEATKSSSARLPLHSGERPLFTNILHMMDSGIVHIWYNIPSSTNFAQKFNGDGLRNKLGHFIPSPQIYHSFQRNSFQEFSLAIHGGYQKTISGPQPPGPAGSGLYFLSRFLRGQFQEAIKHSISCQGMKYFRIPWTTKLVHTGCIQESCMALALLGQFIFHSANSIKNSNTQAGQICIDPKQSIKPGINPPGSVFQLFTYTGYPFFPGDVFPS